MRLKLTFLELLFCFSAAAPGFGAAEETPWNALERLPKHAPYTVLKRDGSCVTGTFGSISQNWLILNVNKRHPRSLLRTDILRMSLGDTADIHATVYSGRSSWLDIKALQTPPSHADLVVITTDAREFTGRFLGASEEELNVNVDGSEMRFSKAYVTRVLLRSAEPGDRKKISPTKQPVPLYEVSAKQDNSWVDCLAYRRQ